MNTNRVPPNNVDAERALLGSMLIDPEKNRENVELAMATGVIPEIFYNTKHAIICSAIYNLYDQRINIDLVTLSKELIDMQSLQEVGDVAYLDEIIESTPTSANLIYYAKIVQEHCLRRHIIDYANKLYEAGFMDNLNIENEIKVHLESINNIKELYTNNHKKQGLTAKEIMQMDIPEPMWLVRDYVPEGLCLIAGAPKIGKSWATLQLAVGVANERGYFLGTEPVDNHGDVLYLALEDSLGRIKSRLRVVCHDGVIPEKLEFWEDLPRLSQGGLVKLENWIKSVHNPRLIVIDVFEKVRSIPDKYKTAYTQDYEELGLLKQISKKYSLTIVLVDHRRKAESDDIMNTIQGSVGKQGAPDGLIVITRPRSERMGILSRTGKDFENEDDMAIEFSIEQYGGWKLVGNAQDFQISEQKQKILDLLKEANEPMTPKQIADSLEANPSFIRGTLRRLVSDMKIKQFGYGKYMINYKNNDKNPL